LSLLAAVAAVVFLHRALHQRVAVQEACALGRYQSLAALLTQLRSVLVELLERNLMLKVLAETLQYLAQ